MHQGSNQPAKSYGKAKTYKFEQPWDRTKENIKFGLIIDQTGAYTYNAAKMRIKVFLKRLPPLEEDKDDVLYDVESLLANIQLKETIDYIIHQICAKKKLTQIHKKLLFKRLILKLATECKINFSNSFF